ncbi:hypothetical protein HJC23_005761 [Cyclotella cryptica]|uniref:Uncharacterized protein n=1 Tax=Cyclotella cryptica TaxID=29204 RepID=A0ABD3NGU7_9STRA
MTTKISCAFFTLLLLSPCFTTARKSATIDPTLSRRRMAFLTGPLVDNSRTANKISTYENLGSRSSKMPSCCDASILSTRPLNRILNRIPVTSGSTRLFSLKPAALPLMDSGEFSGDYVYRDLIHALLLLVSWLPHAGDNVPFFLISHASPLGYLASLLS